MHLLTATLSLALSNCARAQGDWRSHPNFAPANWYTVESLGCYRTVSPQVETGTPPPLFVRLDVQRNRISGAMDSAVGTSGEPTFYRELPSYWQVIGDSVVLRWWSFACGLHIRARSEVGRLSGMAQPETDFGGPLPAFAFVAVAIDCAAGAPRWYHVSNRGGKR